MENGGSSEGDRGTPWEDLLWEGSPQDVREGIPEDLRFGPGRHQDGAAREDEPSNGAPREDEARDKTGAEFVASEEDGIPVRGDDNGLQDPGEREVLILLSESMPPLLLEAVFREHCGDPSVSLVFRGIPEDEADMGILPFLGRLQQAARQICPRGIRILLDHRPFSRFQAAMVPIMAWRLRDGAGGGPQEGGELLGAGDRRHGERDHKVEASCRRTTRPTPSPSPSPTRTPTPSSTPARRFDVVVVRTPNAVDGVQAAPGESGPDDLEVVAGGGEIGPATGSHLDPGSGYPGSPGTPSDPPGTAP